MSSVCNESMRRAHRMDYTQCRNCACCQMCYNCGRCDYWYFEVLRKLGANCRAEEQDQHVEQQNTFGVFRNSYMLSCHLRYLETSWVWTMLALTFQRLRR